MSPPWKSVYKIHHLCSSEITFLLTSGGHNAGIVSPPDHPRRTYQVRTRRPEERYTDPDTWVEKTPQQPGSWWPEWQQWIVQRTSKQKVKPPATIASEHLLDNAPGRYVLER